MLEPHGGGGRCTTAAPTGVRLTSTDSRPEETWRRCSGGGAAVSGLIFRILMEKQ